jgi:hypothetical protein
VKYVMRGLVILLSFGCAVKAQPRLLIVEGDKFSFGTVYRGEVAEKRLTLRNAGTDTLVLDRVDVSCGCTGTIMSAKRIPGGTSGTLLITFNSKNFSGRVHKTVMIHSNALDKPEQVVEFTAEVINEILLTPSQFWFKDAEVGRLNKVVLTVKNNSTGELFLKSFRTALDGFTLRLPEAPLKPGAEIQMTAEYTPKKALPFLAEGVFVLTSNTHQPEIYIPIYGNVKEFKFQ